MSVYRDLHILFNRVQRHRFPYDEGLFSMNGIYILFENGEHYNGLDRIVRIGSHRGFNKLIQRINEHYLKSKSKTS